MKTKATFNDLQEKINQLASENQQAFIDFNSVSPTDNRAEVLDFEKADKLVHNYVTDWELE